MYYLLNILLACPVIAREFMCVFLFYVLLLMYIVYIISAHATPTVGLSIYLPHTRVNRPKISETFFDCVYDVTIETIHIN